MSALSSYLTNPPLTKEARGARKNTMAPLAHSSVTSRLKELCKFVGFCHLHLHMHISITHVMDPQAIAKYCGFLVARGLLPSSIRHACMQLMQTIHFVYSAHCPHTGFWSTAHIDSIKKWYTNLCLKASQAQRDHDANPTPPTHTLWAVWEHAKGKWASFKSSFHANGSFWTAALANECQMAALSLLVCGAHQPPMRIGGLRVLHTKATTTPCALSSCPSPTSCPTNHISYIKDRHGMHACLELVHFKNSKAKGRQSLPLAPQLIEVVVHLEQAAAFLNSPTIFCQTCPKGPKPPAPIPYHDAYFSTVCTQAIAIPTITAVVLRHMFITLWRDFISHPHTNLHSLNAQQLEVAAANLMLNSTHAWDSYDDSTRHRGTSTAMAMWPAFSSFAHEHHLTKSSEEEWDPLDIDLDDPPSEW